jgi:hypothetical protein
MPATQSASGPDAAPAVDDVPPPVDDIPAPDAAVPPPAEVAAPVATPMASKKNNYETQVKDAYCESFNLDERRTNHGKYKPEALYQREAG